MKTFLLVLVIAAAWVVRIQAATPLPVARPEEVGMSYERLRRVDDFVARLRAEGKLAGAVTIVARRGQLVSLVAHGFSDLETKREMRTDDLFHLQSMAKPVVTVAALMLLEEGRLLLSDPVERFLPEFHEMKVAVKTDTPEGFNLVPAVRPITIQDLLTHRSGFPGLPSHAGPAEALARTAFRSMAADGPYNLETFVKKLATLPLNLQPGTAYRYADANAEVLGRVIEVISGRTLDEFFRERIFEPLHMADTFFSVPPEKRQRVVSVYRRLPEKGLVKLPPDPPTTQFYSAGGNLYSTPSDYLRFCQMLLNGGQLDGRRLLGRKSIDLMTAYQVDSVAPFLRGQYIGLNAAVQKADGESGLLSSPGAYGWAGSYLTYFRIDPHEQLILLFFAQQAFSPGNSEVMYGFQNTVMQALID